MRKVWLETLLLGILSFCSCQAKPCVVGVLGESVFLPCLYNGAEDLTSLNISFEWRRGAEVVYKAVWTKGHERSNEKDSDRTKVSSLLQTGDFTLELRDIHFIDAQNYSVHLKLLDHGVSELICTVCLSVAAHFTPPVLLREGEAEEKATPLVCQSWGGFPKPAVHWHINRSQHPPVEAVTTHMNDLPSQLYNITSVLYTHLPKDTTVSCAIENHLLNETLTTTNFGVKSSSAHKYEYIWKLSIVLCILVAVLVTISLCFQRKWDKEARREREDDSACEETEMIMMDTEYLDGLPMTDRRVE